MAIIGLDIGTSGCKAAIIDYEGSLLGQAYREYALVKPKPGWEELDPELVWHSVKEVITESLGQHQHKDIQAISVSSFGEAAIALDKAGRVLYNSIIYIDSRGQEEAAFLKEHLGHGSILSITGASVHPMYTIHKIMWIKKHMPEIYNKTWKFMLFADYILFRLGASPHTDYSLAARTMAFDIVHKKWSASILDCAGVAEEKFAEPVQSGTNVGQLSASVAKELGLPLNVILVAGGHDQPCAALGAGVIKSNLAVDGLGTTECITPAFSQPVISENMAQYSFACVPHVVRDMYVTYAFTFTSGSLLKWYKNTFGAVERQEAAQMNVNVYDLLMEKAAGKPSEIFLLPHFAGAATPYMDTEAKGAIIGLTINTGKDDMIKAIMEGITYEMMVNVEKLTEAGIAVDELRAVGGLTKSQAFLQLKADMMGKRVVTLNISEAGTLGVAILAGTACGAYKSIEDAVKNLVKIKKVFEPDLKKHAYYRDRFQMYKKIYPAMKSIYR